MFMCTPIVEISFILTMLAWVNKVLLSSSIFYLLLYFLKLLACYIFQFTTWKESTSLLLVSFSQHFGIIDDDELKDRLSFSDEELISDCESSFQQFEMLRLSAMSTGSDVRFTKVKKSFPTAAYNAGAYTISHQSSLVWALSDPRRLSWWVKSSDVRQSKVINVVFGSKRVRELV